MRCATRSTPACAIAETCLSSADSDDRKEPDMVRRKPAVLFPLTCGVGLFVAACGPAANPAPSGGATAAPIAPTTAPAAQQPTSAAVAKATPAAAAQPTST